MSLTPRSASYLSEHGDFPFWLTDESECREFGTQIASNMRSFAVMNHVLNANVMNFMWFGSKKKASARECAPGDAATLYVEEYEGTVVMSAPGCHDVGRRVNRDCCTGRTKFSSCY